MKNKSKHERYRMSDFTARKIGLIPNSEMRYRLKKNSKARKKYFELDIGEPIKRLFFDIETSQYECRSFRIGYNLNLQYANVTKLARIICISWSWESEDKVHNLRWDEKQCDKQMLLDFIEVMNIADEVIGHNGDRFDIKWIRTRCLFHRIPMFPNYRSLDTLKKAKSHFRFPNNRLDTIAKYCGVGGKVEHRGLIMWNETEDGDLKALDEMVYYCDGDIVVLKDVYYVMQNYIKHNTHTGTHSGRLKHSCPNCGSEDVYLFKNNFTALGTIKRQMECKTCGYSYETSNSAYKNFILL